MAKWWNWRRLIRRARCLSCCAGRCGAPAPRKAARSADGGVHRRCGGPQGHRGDAGWRTAGRRGALCRSAWRAGAAPSRSGRTGAAHRRPAGALLRDGLRQYRQRLADRGWPAGADRVGCGIDAALCGRAAVNAAGRLFPRLWKAGPAAGGIRRKRVRAASGSAYDHPYFQAFAAV